MPRLPAVLTLAGALLLTLPGATVAAWADEPPADTTPPRIDTTPVGCGDPCRREVYEFWGDLVDGDDLATLDVRLDDDVVDHRVYDDGTGFTPYGWYQPWGADYLDSVDYAVRVAVPSGDHTVTVTAADLDGNVTEHAYAVSGAQAPDAVRHLRAHARGHRVTLRFAPGADNGGLITAYRIVRDGDVVRTRRTGPFQPSPRVVFRHLAPGRHRFAVRAVNSAGAGAPAVVRARILDR